jgi:hypothetical protein
LYVGILLIAFGAVFLLAQAGGLLLAPFGIRFGWGTVWPLFVLLAGLAFWLPIFVWWERHEKIAGLAVPGTIIVVNGLLLLYQNLTGDWNSWEYAWALEPLSVGLGLFMLYLLGNQNRGLLTASGIVAGIGMVFFIIFASIFGGAIRIVGPAALILAGVLLMLRGARRQPTEPFPPE